MTNVPPAPLNDPPLPETAHVSWPKSHRIISSRYPPIDLFEDIADPADWEALASAEAKTNPRIASSVGALDLVPIARRVSGEGASWVMAPFTHVSPDRKGRFTDGSFGAYYAANSLEGALFETIHHHGIFMKSTHESAGWSSQFRELVGSVDTVLHDIRDTNTFADCYDADTYNVPQKMAKALRAQGSNGLVYSSVRHPQSQCIATFWPDVIPIPKQGHHFAYYWDGHFVSKVQNLSTQEIFSVEI